MTDDKRTTDLTELVAKLATAATAANDETPRATDARPLDVDALALAIAAAVRVGERGLHRAVNDDEVMDAEDVAAFLGVDRKTVYDYAARGEIPCRRLGKRLLFSRTALVAWLGSCKVVSRVNGA
jgi:excisionase family DNA binding protein